MDQNPAALKVTNTCQIGSKRAVAIRRADTTDWKLIEPGQSIVLRFNDLLALKWTRPTSSAEFVYRLTCEAAQNNQVDDSDDESLL